MSSYDPQKQNAYGKQNCTCEIAIKNGYEFSFTLLKVWSNELGKNKIRAKNHLLGIRIITLYPHFLICR